MSAIKKLERLIGKKFLYKTHQLEIKNVAEDEGSYILTDEYKTLALRECDVDKFIESLLPVSDDEFVPKLKTVTFNGESLVKNHYPTPMPQNQLTKSAPMDDSLQKSADLMGSLKDVLMSNIKELKTNKEFIGQAQEINSNVRSLIDLMKTEVMMVRTLKGK